MRFRNSNKPSPLISQANKCDFISLLRLQRAAGHFPAYGVYREGPDPFSQSVQSLEMRVISARLCRTNCLLINRVTLPECLLEDRVSERRLIALSTSRMSRIASP